jgi:DNA-binding CsgD family transcriptional regulator
MRQGEEVRQCRPMAGMRMTARESEVLAWVAAGKSDWAIGQILNISGKTVNFHVENAKRKLGVATRVQAVVAALRTGIIG